jgi:hypothetical protein
VKDAKEAEETPKAEAAAATEEKPKPATTRKAPAKPRAKKETEDGS